jgi:hypothetical protein
VNTRRGLSVDTFLIYNGTALLYDWPFDGRAACRHRKPVLLLDPFTLFISNALLHLALMLALAIISRLAPDILAIRLWMRGHGLMALAIVLMAVMALLSPEARPPLKLLIGGLLMSALLLMLAGLRHFFGLHPLPLALRVGYVLALLGLAGLMQWSPEVPLAGVWQASVLMVLLLGCVHVLWRQRGHLRPIVLLAWPA